MYLARFDNGTHQFVSAALRWPHTSLSLVPAGWHQLLLHRAAPDAAVGIGSSRSGGLRHWLFLSAPASEAAKLKTTVDRLLNASRPQGLSIASDAGEFDDHTQMWPLQYRVDPSGYSHGSESLACPFSLWPVASQLVAEGAASYCIHFRPHPCEGEVERAARKYLAKLQTLSPFSDRVREVQRTLAERTLKDATLAAEFVCFSNADARDRLLTLAGQHFAETLGRIGFPQPPLDAGNYCEWLSTGRHPSRDERGLSVAALGASIMTFNEAALLLDSPLLASTGGTSTGASPHPADVFISHSSVDFAKAGAACTTIESAGIPCWIAPRNIDLVSHTYPTAILRGIDNAKAILVLVSSTTLQSVHVPREVELALTRKIPIIAVDLDDTPLTGDLRLLLASVHRTRGYTKSYDEVLSEVLQRVSNALKDTTRGPGTLG